MPDREDFGLKVLHLIYDDVGNPWIGGGGARRTIEIYKRFPDDCEVSVVTGPYPGAKRREEIGRVLFERPGFGRTMILSGASYCAGAVKRVHSGSYDLVVEDFSPFTPCLAPLHTRKPTLALVQNVFGLELLKMYGPAGWLPYAVERRALKLFGNFIAVSKHVKESIASLTPSFGNLQVIPSGVSEQPLTLSRCEENFILFMGRLEIYQKGIDLLLQSFDLLASKREGIRLVLAGGGPQEELVRHMVARCKASSRIDVLGRVSEKRKFDLMSRSMAVCIPSRFESWGIVALEAAACGKPVVATRISGLDETVVDGQTGLLSTPSPENIAQALLWLIRDPYLRTRLGIEARRRAAFLTWDSIAQKQYAFYRVCIGEDPTI